MASFKFKRKSKETKNKIYFKKDTPINTFRAKHKKNLHWLIDL